MSRHLLARDRLASRRTGRRSRPPALEHLESRLLLYSTLGDQWTYSSRITYSFMPDGTSVGGVPSALFQTLNAVTSTATWQAQFEQAAALWENAANLNLALVSDGGEPVGTNGDQQDDPRFGDIRIGAIPLPSGVLAETFLPPPANGGTAAGDILFNSTEPWAINNTYDVMTVAAHEFGHALGLGESGDVSAVMYGTYNGIKQSLTGDDISGIDSIYGVPQYDSFNSNGSHNSSVFTAANITSDLNGQGQIALPGLDLTVPGQAEWFSVTVPNSNSGHMTVTMQSSNLSSLEPGLMIYNSLAQLITQTSSATPGGATISITLSVAAGQKYYIKDVAALSGTDGTVGGYGLLVNFGNQTQSPIPPPNTVVPQQPNGGGGVVTNVMEADTNAIGVIGSPTTTMGPTWVALGNLTGWALPMHAAAPGSSTTITSTPTQPSPVPAGEGGSMGALSFPLPTRAGSAAITPQSSSSTGPPVSLVVAPLPVVDVVFQGIDTVLEDWHGHHHRPAAARYHRR